MSSRRGKRREEPPEEHPDERWMASYMDMVTVLMCMFIVLFAMSSVDADKFEKLRLSLSTGFGTTVSETVDTAEGIVVPPNLVNSTGDVPPPEMVAAQAEVDDLEKIRDRIDKKLAKKGLDSSVKYEINERGLVVRLVGAATFFEGNSVDLTPRALRVLDSIGDVLASISQEIAVEGHADPHGSSGPYATDWELSSGRAVQVVRYFVEDSHVSGKRTGAIGFGSSRPITTGKSAAAMALNRRVDVVVLSGKPESVRALIPDILKLEKSGKSVETAKAPTN